MSTESSSATFGQAFGSSREGGYGEVVQHFLQASIKLVEKKMDFEAVPDQNHSGAAIPVRTLYYRVCDDCMHAGASCCLQFQHNYWDSRE